MENEPFGGPQQNDFLGASTRHKSMNSAGIFSVNSRRIFLTGEVTHSGAMPLLPHMTMLQALAAAGFTQFASVKKIYLLRSEGGKQKKYPFNYKDVVRGRHPEQNIELQPGDTLVVP